MFQNHSKYKKNIRFRLKFSLLNNVNLYRIRMDNYELGAVKKVKNSLGFCDRAS